MKANKFDKIKIISFDAFNTLFNAKSYHEDACKIILDLYTEKRNRKIDVYEFHKRWDQLIINGWERLNDIDQEFKTQKEFFLDTIIQLFNEYDIQGDPKKALQIWYDLLENIELFEEVPEVLDIIKDKGYPIMILSNIDNDFLYNNLKKFSLTNKFDYIFTSENLKAYKPHIRIFKKVLTHIQLNSNEILHIGDSQYADVFGAKNAGFYAAYLNRKNSPLKKHIPKPDLIINNLKELLKFI